MSMLSWGKCTIKLGKLGEDDAAPSSWIDVPTPAENTTELVSTKGDKTEAKVEGGENEDVRYAKNAYTLNFNIRAAKGRKKPVEDNDGVIDGFYSLKLQPEDPTVEGIEIAKGVLSMTPTYTSADGTIWQYTLDVLKPKTGNSIEFKVVDFSGLSD